MLKRSKNTFDRMTAIILGNPKQGPKALMPLVKNADATVSYEFIKRLRARLVLNYPELRIRDNADKQDGVSKQKYVAPVVCAKPKISLAPIPAFRDNSKRL